MTSTSNHCLTPQVPPPPPPPPLSVCVCVNPPLCACAGQCCAHLQCATWSEGVCRGEGQSLLYVDKAIDTGSTQVGFHGVRSVAPPPRVAQVDEYCEALGSWVCASDGLGRKLWVFISVCLSPVQVCVFCRQLGASLRCQEMDCGRCYHFPCAAAAGAHLDWNQRRTLCTRHAHAGKRR